MHVVQGWTHREMEGNLLHCWEIPQWQCDGLLRVHERLQVSYVQSFANNSKWFVGYGGVYRNQY